MSTIVTVTLFRFPDRERFWAFSQMALARPLLRNVSGMTFAKLMGTGRGVGFTKRPDWNRYALLAAWKSEEDARRFLVSSDFIARYTRRTERVGTAFLRTVSAHGSWNGRNPFSPADASRGTEVPDAAAQGWGSSVAVLTRATIRFSRLRHFWSMVEPASRQIAEASGLRASIGIGEAPFVRQATFSIWESLEDLRSFAYASGTHRDIVRRTREEGWYSEDLFARFAIIDVVGDFPGVDPNS